MKQVFIGLGSNIGNKHKHLHTAIGHIQAIPQTTLIAVSTFYVTPAWGNIHQEDFLNACVQVQTLLTADTLMRYLLAIEEGMGRVRSEHKWQPRIIDLDILDYNQEVICTDIVTTPHPYLDQRLFALLPLQELFPAYIHPVLRISIQEMIENIKSNPSREAYNLTKS
ncbi:MAG: 2-amino-4-hydroxy-6-hydroxymethyldihydropteridine diphosphokinase [Bacteroidia bacterium]|nr:2-amino-4-hydroxy-6-hydroxymethyldihydropteridine diphosphokinase [Bacteroidia bacterium]MDW8345629.1 2-amino-4-hydroxy-6-hydroxymethyldihydropteridine diphosphokinase [Bacteroidia bacterium]